MKISDYIKSEYKFREIIDFQKLPLETKEQITNVLTAHTAKFERMVKMREILFR